jgi:hypothetical protein
MVTCNVNFEGLRDLIVSNKYSLLSSRVQLGSLFIPNVYKHWKTKYLEIDYFWLLFRENLFGGFEPMFTMG